MERKCDVIEYFERDLISEFSKNATNAIGKTDAFRAVLCSQFYAVWKETAKSVLL
jgi:hypothetical protein